MVKMKNSIKLFFASILFVCSTSVFAQNVDIVTLTTTAEGRTKDEAVTNALRSAIEQAFGTFISSNTKIVNDEIVKDEIVTVSNGNVKKYDVLSSSSLPTGNTVVSVQSQVSLSKLTSFCKNKGIEVEFEGALFSANIKLQDLYERNEIAAVNNLSLPFTELAQHAFDYTISAKDPVSQGTTKLVQDNSNYNRSKGQWEIPLTITVAANQNFFSPVDMLYTTP